MFKGPHADPLKNDRGNQINFLHLPQKIEGPKPLMKHFVKVLEPWKIAIKERKIWNCRWEKLLVVGIPLDSVSEFGLFTSFRPKFCAKSRGICGINTKLWEYSPDFTFYFNLKICSDESWTKWKAQILTRNREEYIQQLLTYTIVVRVAG